MHGMVRPVQSSDINITENCWLKVKTILQNRAGEITNPSLLLEGILDIWMNFSLEYTQNLYNMACISNVRFPHPKRDNSYKRQSFFREYIRQEAVQEMVSARR
jgi:hypothetical protein